MPRRSRSTSDLTDSRTSNHPQPQPLEKIANCCHCVKAQRKLRSWRNFLLRAGVAWILSVAMLLRCIIRCDLARIPGRAVSYDLSCKMKLGINFLLHGRSLETIQYTRRAVYLTHTARVGCCFLARFRWILFFWLITRSHTINSWNCWIYCMTSVSLLLLFWAVGFSLHGW